MQHGKRIKKKKTKPSVELGPQEEALVVSLLKTVRKSDPSHIIQKIPNAKVARSLIDRLPLDEEYSIPLIMKFKNAFKDKEVQKAIRRILFKLQKKGTAVEASISGGDQDASVLRPVHTEDPSAFVGPLDASGTRSVLVILPRQGMGVDMGFGLVSDDHGIRQFRFGAFSKKGVREVKKNLNQNAGPLVETSLSHVTTILEQAYQRHKEIKMNVLPEYLELRPLLLERAPLLKKPPIYEFVSKDSISGKTLTTTQIKDFFEQDLMNSWGIEFERIRPYLEDIFKSKDSLLVLTDTQKMERVREIREKCIKELFPASRRAALKQRLEEMAYMFFRMEKEKEAKQAISMALALDEKDSALRTNPVIEYLVDRTLDFYIEAIKKGSEEQQPQDNQPPRIITP